jgi:hypothetical protein
MRDSNSLGSKLGKFRLHCGVGGIFRGLGTESVFGDRSEIESLVWTAKIWAWSQYKSFNVLHISLSLHKIRMGWTKKGIPDHVRGGLCEISAFVSERYVRVFRTPLPPFFLLPSRPTIQQVSALTIFRSFWTTYLSFIWYGRVGGFLHVHALVEVISEPGFDPSPSSTAFSQSLRDIFNPWSASKQAS